MAQCLSLLSDNFYSCFNWLVWHPINWWWCHVADQSGNVLCDSSFHYFILVIYWLIIQTFWHQVIFFFPLSIHICCYEVARPLEAVAKVLLGGSWGVVVFYWVVACLLKIIIKKKRKKEKGLLHDLRQISCLQHKQCLPQQESLMMGWLCCFGWVICPVRQGQSWTCISKHAHAHTHTDTHSLTNRDHLGILCHHPAC